MKKTILVAMCSLALGGCAGLSHSNGPSQSAIAQQRLRQADLAVKTTRAKGALWLATPHELALARKAAAQGHYAKAIKAADVVLTQCRVAQRQAASNAHAKPYYP